MIESVELRAEALEEQLKKVRMENDHLRVLAAKSGCPYGHLSATGGCELGYPGCACMDDLMAIQSWSPEDEEKVVVRLGKRLALVETALATVKKAYDLNFADTGMDKAVAEAFALVSPKSDS